MQAGRRLMMGMAEVAKGGGQPKPLDTDDTAATAAQVGAAPLVSVIMANYNGAAYLQDAVASVLDQSHSELELIVVDDASDDGSHEILRKWAASDARVRPIFLTTNVGAAGARNIAVGAARGAWIAIVDADDLIHPMRIERLLATAQRMGADAVADDLLSFGASETAGQTLLADAPNLGPKWITAADLVQSDAAIAGLASLGYLKPMIRRDTLGALRYDETLRIGEDFDLYCHLLVQGARFLLTPDPTYLYRRYRGSVSHRLTVPAVASLISSHDRLADLAAAICPTDEALMRQLARRRARLGHALRYQELVAALKSRDLPQSIRHLCHKPSLLADLVKSGKDRMRRKHPFRQKSAGGKAMTLVLAAPDRLDQVAAPSGAIRLPVQPSTGLDGADGTGRRKLACQLARLAGQGPVDVVADGLAGLEALGYIPMCRSKQLVLCKEDAEKAPIPQGVVLQLR